MRCSILARSTVSVALASLTALIGFRVAPVGPIMKSSKTFDAVKEPHFHLLRSIMSANILRA